MNIDKLEKIMTLMRKHGVTEVAYENKEDGENLKLKIHTTVQTVAAPAPAAPAPIAAAPAPAQEDSSSGLKLKSNQSVIRSPFVGTFYSAPSPGAEPFVKVGQKIKKGDVLCIVEAMKLMNEIEAEIEGIVVELLVKNGQPLEYNQLWLTRGARGIDHIG